MLLNCIFISSHYEIAVINSGQQYQHEILSPGVVAHSDLSLTQTGQISFFTMF